MAVQLLLETPTSVCAEGEWDEVQIVNWCHVTLTNQEAQRVRTRQKLSHHRAELLPCPRTRPTGFMLGVTLKNCADYFLLSECRRKDWLLQSLQ